MASTLPPPLFTICILAAAEFVQKWVHWSDQANKSLRNIYNYFNKYRIPNLTAIFVTFCSFQVHISMSNWSIRPKHIRLITGHRNNNYTSLTCKSCTDAGSSWRQYHPDRIFLLPVDSSIQNMISFCTNTHPTDRLKL